MKKGNFITVCCSCKVIPTDVAFGSTVILLLMFFVLQHNSKDSLWNYVWDAICSYFALSAQLYMAHQCFTFLLVLCATFRFLFVLIFLDTCACPHCFHMPSTRFPGLSVKLCKGASWKITMNARQGFLHFSRVFLIDHYTSKLCLLSLFAHQLISS